MFTSCLRGINENGKLSLSEKIVFKLVEVNETAYKLIPVEVNKTSLLGRQFYIYVVELLQNRTGGIINTYRDYLALPHFSFYIVDPA